MCKSGLFFWLITLILAQTASKVNSTPKHMSYNIDCATYSTSQEVACGTWVDGKTIYKKTIDLGTLPNNSTKNVQYNIPNFSRLVKLEGSAYRSTDGANFPLPFASNSGVNVIAISIDTAITSITVVTNTDRSNMTGYITMYYTKS